MAGPSTKRRRASSTERDDATAKSAKIPASLSHPISPPRKKRGCERNLIPSPIRLTTIKDLPEESNTGAISLHDILGDPLIAECWEFNFMHDVDFLMSHFDEDIRSHVKVHIVHGYWKRNDHQSSKYQNVTLHTAYMPEMFGTHHSKMIILFRHDFTAQVIIHTANMIPKDWTNLTNGVWLSPLLPRLTRLPKPSEIDLRVGYGARFKADLLNYLRAYNTRRPLCESMINELEKYDFSAVRGALVASVPGKHDIVIDDDDPTETPWGWAGLKHTLSSVPCEPGRSEIVVQISSIATLGPTDTWLKQILFNALSSSRAGLSKPEFKILFPTPDEIRRSLDGYASGASIHMKIQSASQAKQLQYLKPMLYHWANDCEKGILEEGEIRDAGRNRAAPHIKTYIRYNEKKSIDWALLTSANLSKQAWGEAANAGEMRISSWEMGVLVWPELFAQGAKMVPTLKTDMPSKDDLEGDEPLVGLRIPYSLPLQKYANDEGPWVATAKYTEPDCMGQTWNG
ncbi:phospholipase D/nuclease [Daldinia caldariorum]|uniref:phospholipase D/nuclease n=1 Tax=Daldinia caldariorum TaxID=326644 RepID=UPI002008191D|nr:phospholipase D/nuclease [Daldinia caldariorum]KAI1470364.1 phospholipase D/nuclease [Daldinia caldariorum]